MNNGIKIPEFLLKLKKLVDSTQTDHLIRWSDNGETFLISDGQSLAKDFFPLLFKHRNVFSFIRQLNMYGFHKINRVDFGMNKNNFDDSEWSHPYFIRDRYDLLSKIQRKTAVSTDVSPWNNYSSDPLTNKVNFLKTTVNNLRERDCELKNRMYELERHNSSMRGDLEQINFDLQRNDKILQELMKMCLPNRYLENKVKKSFILPQLPAIRITEEPLVGSDDMKKIITRKQQTNENQPQLKIESSICDTMDENFATNALFPNQSRSPSPILPNEQDMFNDEDDCYGNNQFLVDSSTTLSDYDIDDLLQNN